MTDGEHSGETLSAEEAASLLGISARAVYRNAAKGVIPAIHLGRRIRILRRPLLEMLRLTPGSLESDNEQEPQR